MQRTVLSVDPGALTADPHRAYAELRAAGPVHRVTGTDGKPAWLVTRYEDVRRALADSRLALDRRHALPGNYAGFNLPPALDANLLNMDPPDHTRVRRLVAKAFTPARVEKLREPVRKLAHTLLDAVEPDGRAELIAAYAGPLPITVICDLLGVPHASRPDFRAWTDTLITPDPERPEAARQAVGAMLRFYTGLISGKRETPGDDLLSDLIAVRDDDGDRLTEDELTSLAFLILFAGYENTVHLIGNSVLALLDHPEALRSLRGRPDTELADAVDELARFEGPAPLAIRRFPVEDLDVGGVTVPAGETVLLSLASANRDPERFPEPDTLQPASGGAGHLALGHGIHYCLGAALARMETGVALSVLLDRLPGLRLAVPRDTLRHRPTFRARGLLTLPVTW
ncbi:MULTISPECIES: cytochrome P450 family protein [unclassified Streptomyces]|uniref:cytochrome P450 family protein n=1 Tax=unclassified Streptomyces TaxID=2593676 RepID=UPI0022B65705|nr:MULTISPECIES: cytochrome P450 [unclassified Streptomyces]MCZ7416932.1 cytochrome P450 [Streptomyces sp. WMMC897]MCZ7433238.1 cytochrome P450 [Streptomyces sp. WMMC1477]